MVTRRGFLKGAVGALTAGTLAGCLGSSSGSSGTVPFDAEYSGQYIQGVGNIGDTHIGAIVSYSAHAKGGSWPKFDREYGAFHSGYFSSRASAPLEVYTHCTFYDIDDNALGSGYVHYSGVQPQAYSDLRFYYQSDEEGGLSIPHDAIEYDVVDWWARIE